ncbi:hypothetical protein J3F84DRAFT_196506 [Trichoderma pleuroticola]
MRGVTFSYTVRCLLSAIRSAPVPAEISSITGGLTVIDTGDLLPTSTALDAPYGVHTPPITCRLQISSSASRLRAAGQPQVSGWCPHGFPSQGGPSRRGPRDRLG